MTNDSPKDVQFQDFVEEDRVRDGPMRDEILTVVIEALNAQGMPEISAQSIHLDPSHRNAVLDMLADCRPMPVVLKLIAELEDAPFSEGNTNTGNGSSDA